MSRRWSVRQYEASDFSGVVQLLKDAFESSSQESVLFSVSTKNTTAFVAVEGESVEGVAMTIVFSGTAWIGSVVVSPLRQRQGVGGALIEHAVELARAEADNVLLLALEPARRLYERMGFVDDGVYGTWVLPSAAQGGDSRRSARNESKDASLESLDQCLQLDHLATGENRRAYLEPLASAIRLVPGETPSRMPLGFSAQLDWGAGPVIARDARVGEHLIRNVLADNPHARIEFPDENEAGLALMSDLRLTRVDDDYRMRLGPPVPGYHPEFIYRVLTPAVG